MTSKVRDRLQSLQDRGFDQTYLVRGGMLRVRCSQCEAVCINGIACHETGCPNARQAKLRTCAECGTVHVYAEDAAECCAPVED